MTIIGLAAKEIRHRKLNFALALLSVAMAVACLVGAMTLLNLHDLRTQEILAAKQAETRQAMAGLEDEMRKAMLGLGFNIVILSKDQDLHAWHADDFAASYMPEEYARRLAQSKIVTVQHILPTLQQKVRWPEKRRSIILVGSRGELAGSGGKKPMVPVVPPGKIVLGNELHESLSLNAGDKLTLLGREFVVQQCYPMRGNKDDVTAWIDLSAAQELAGKKGLINAILALECQCAFADLPKVREEIVRILPNTQVIERGSQALARAEVRRKVAAEAAASLEREAQGRAQLRAQRQQVASLLVPLVMLAAAVWIALLARGNVHDRRSEIGVLRAVGVGGGQIMLLLLSKAVLIGLLGGVLGVLAGSWAGIDLSTRLESSSAGTPSVGAALHPLALAAVLGLAPFLAAVASWIPIMLAIRQDPAVVLREE